MAIEILQVPVRAATCGPQAHFFGYYDKPPWDASGRRLLAVEAPAVDRMPLPDEPARIVVIDLATGTPQVLAETRAWNWQQGCMLQWLPDAADRRIIYNDREGDRHVAVVLDLATGDRRVLPRPVYAVAPDASFYLSTSLARLARERPVVGYAGVTDPFADDPAPLGDGVWRVDLATGVERLILPYAALPAFHPRPDMTGVHHRAEHLTIAPDGRRFFFLHRWRGTSTEFGGRRNFLDRLLTCGCDGHDLRLLADDGFISHFDWRDPQHILAWSFHPGSGKAFHLYHDADAAPRSVVAPGVLVHDMHCSYSPDRRWILGDTYPAGDSQRHVLLYEVASGRLVEIGAFRSPPPVDKGDIRCDLHPRWSRDGRQVCIDSAHEGPRQMYLLDVGAVVG